MSKITIKHYLNTDLKPIKSALGNEYKIYFLLRYLNQNTKIKSLIINTFTEVEYLEIEKNKIVQSWQNLEVSLCVNTITALEKCDYTFDIKTFMQFYEFAKYPILENLNNYLEWQKHLHSSDLLNHYNKMNLENLIECFQNLKKIVYNNENFINNEIYFGNYKEVKKLLSKIKLNIFESVKVENREFEDYVNPKYEIKKYSFLDYFVSKIMLELHFRLPEITILPLKSIDTRIDKEIINSFIVI